MGEERRRGVHLEHQGSDRCWPLRSPQLELDSGSLSCPQSIPVGPAFLCVPLPANPQSPQARTWGL